MDDKPPHHRAEHLILTPRLEIRSARPGEGKAIYELLSAPANHVHTEVEPGISPEVYEGRILKWRDSTASGKNAFMVVCLRQDDAITQTPSGTVIGFGGFNSLPTEPMIESPGSSDLGLLGDIGILIDHRFWRRGFASEATIATIEYGFNELGVGAIWMDTKTTNEPLRKMMAFIGLESSGRAESRREGGGRSRKIEEPRSDWWVWEFGPSAWNRAKESGAAFQRRADV